MKDFLSRIRKATREGDIYAIGHRWLARTDGCHLHAVCMEKADGKNDECWRDALAVWIGALAKGKGRELYKIASNIPIRPQAHNIRFYFEEAYPGWTVSVGYIITAAAAMHNPTAVVIEQLYSMPLLALVEGYGQDITAVAIIAPIEDGRVR